MDNNALIIKVFKIDYSFIIKNYLEPKLWQKRWNLLTYKNYIFTLRMSSIDVQDEKVNFYVRLEDTQNTTDYRDDWNDCIGENYAEEFVQYSLKINDSSFLEKMIDTAMLKCIEKLERKKIMGLEEYQELKAGEKLEEETLTGIAEDFLDANSVKNEDVRNAYIYVFVENNKKIESRLAEYRELKHYKELTDLYLLFANINKNEKLIEAIKENILDYEELRALDKEINEYIKNLETEEFYEEMQGNLEEV